MLFCKFIAQLCWYLIRNLALCPFEAIASAWYDAYSHYEFTKRMRKQSAAQKRPPRTQPVQFVHADGRPCVIEARGDGKKRHRRGHRGGRKHKKHFHHGGGHHS